MEKSLDDILASYIEALYPIIYVNYFDFILADEIVNKAIHRVSKTPKIYEFNNAYGAIDFKSKSPLQECNLVKFLKTVYSDGFQHESYLVLKDIHYYLDNPEVIAILKRISENTLYRENYYQNIIIISSRLVIPCELENYITIFDIPLPNDIQIENLIRTFTSGLKINISEDLIGEFALSFKGLSEFQIRQILNLAYQNGGTIDASEKHLILKEKEQFIKKSAMLELVETSDKIDDIGGLDNLINWLRRKEIVFNNYEKAIKFGVDKPKGIMIIGMPGCGKSLTAKATASLFHIPLVRLDVGRLLGKYVGESEDNMQRALSLAAAISPCILWVDEIEKAFAGVGDSGGGHEVTIRLFGLFLTWLQEKDNTVFVVATANDISRIPPEFLRKGRFDELFFVDLPKEEERAKILEIHLKKRNKWNKDIDIIKLIKQTDGYNGADLESIVKEAIETAFINGINKICTADLINVITETKSITDTLKEKLAQIKITIAKMDIKKANK